MRVYSLVLLGVTLSMAAANNTLRGLQWAGEEIGTHVESKDAFAGLEEPMRVSANTIRVKDGQPALKSDVGLSQAALSLAQELAQTDSKDLKPEATKTLLARATDAGYKGKAVKVNVHSVDAKNIDKADLETHTLTAVGTWAASKDATAALDDPQNDGIGSAGWLSPSGRAYYVQYYGAFR